ncbi:MAG: SpaA isopeptide-forming pilin-related protein [Lachnospiraceae bacterium]
MNKGKGFGCWLLCIVLVIALINPGYTMTAFGEEEFQYLTPEESQIPYFYKTSGSIVVDGETYSIYSFKNTAGTVYYRVYGEQTSGSGSEGFYGCDETGVVVEPLTLYTSAQDEALLGKTSGEEMISDGGVVSSVEVNQFDGTEVFDSDDTPGNDSSDSNGIVRSFDSIIYSVAANMMINSGTYGPDEAKSAVSYVGGTLYVKAEIPKSLQGLAGWDVDNMQWAEQTTLSEDGLTITASYSMSKDKITIPGRQALNLPLNIYGAANGTTVKPSFTMWLEGNETDQDAEGYEAVKQSGVVTTVSAKPSYNIELKRNWSLERKITTSEFGTTDQEGRLYGYGIALQLAQNSGRAETSLKGMEFPTGDISFDLDLTLLKTNDLVTDEDITEKVIPRIWNYNINGGKGDTYAYPERKMNWGTDSYQYPAMPGGAGGTHNSVYDSGQVVMEPDVIDPSIIHVTISGYQFSGEFPYHYLRTNNESAGSEISNNIGYFAVDYVQFFVPFDEEKGAASYKFTVEDTNLAAYSISGTKVTTQAITSDDTESVEHYYSKPGSYIKGNYFYPQTRGQLNTYVKDTTRGMDYASLGQVIAPGSLVSSSSGNSESANSVVMLSKFDDEAMEPILIDGNGWVRHGADNSGTTKMKFHMLYAVKTDGTGWESDTEMYLADIEDLEYYDSYEEWQASGKPCVAVLFESDQTGENGSFDPGLKMLINYYTRIKSTATINYVYQICNRVRLWYDDIDAENRWSLQEDVATPDVILFEENEEMTANTYTKTQYSESGSVVSGHRGAKSGSFPHYWGNSILILGANAQISKVAYDKNAEGTDESATPPVLVEKSINDLDQNETTIYYAILPEIGTSISTGYEQTTTATITDVLPSGVTYKPGSATYQGNPVAPLVSYDEETGLTTLTWILTDLVPGEAISPVYYEASVDQTLANGTNLNSTIEISIPEDVRGSEYRSSTVNVQVVNLATYRLYKEAGQMVRDLGEEITYDIHFGNDTNVSVTDANILDVLPYNGDGRGSSYHGTYQLSDVTTVNGEEVTLYYTTALTWSDVTKTAQDVDLTDSSIWTAYDGISFPDGVTAVIVHADVAAYTTMDISIKLIPDQNQLGDVYGNDATMIAPSFEAPLLASPVSVVIVTRSLNGKAWLDADGNGQYDVAETLLSGITVKLTDESGNEVTDAYGNRVEEITTETDGTYHFDNLTAGRYRVRFVFFDESVINGKKVTVKQKESVPVSINSDAEEALYTDADGNTYAEIRDIVMPSAADIRVLNYIDNYEDLGITPVTGTIRLIKTDATTGAVIPNVEFYLYKMIGSDYSDEDTYIGTYSTDASGEIVVDNLQFGDYYFVEKASVIGYVTNKTPTKVSLNADNYEESNTNPITVTKVNERKTGSFVFTKLDQNGNAITYENREKRGVFQLLDLNHSVLSVYGIPGIDGRYALDFTSATLLDPSDIPVQVSELIPDSAGQITITGLPWSDATVLYYFVEKEAPTGYERTSEELEFYVTVNAKNEVVVTNKTGGALTLQNHPTTAGMVFEKKDDDGGIITSDTASFVLRTSSDITVKLKATEQQGVYELSANEEENTETVLTNYEGRLEILGLPWNEKYKLVETDAPKGYQLSSDAHEFQVPYEDPTLIQDAALSTNSGSNTGSNASIELRTNSDGTQDFTGLLKFPLDSEKKVKSATLRLVAERTKEGSKSVRITNFDAQWEEKDIHSASEEIASSYDLLKTSIDQSRAKTNAVVASLNGVTGKAIFDDASTTLDQWVTEIDVTSLVVANASELNLLLSKNNTSTAQTVIFGKEYAGYPDTSTTNADRYATIQSIVAAAGEEMSYLAPKLIVEYEAMPIVNEKQEGNIQIAKLDERGQPITGSAAVFVLYDQNKDPLTVKRIADGYYQVSEDEDAITEMETNIYSGLLEVAGLPWNDQHYLVEMTPPTGYIRETEPIQFYLLYDEITGTVYYDTNGDGVADTLQVENVKSTGQVQITKVDTEYQPIQNNPATFVLYLTETDEIIPVVETGDGSYRKAETDEAGSVSEIVTGTDGSITIDKLTWGVDYYLKEIQAPVGYKLSGQEISFILDKDEDGNVISQTDLTVVNERKTGELSIRKVDDSGSLITSSAAKFQLYSGTEGTQSSKLVQLVGKDGSYQVLKDGTYEYTATEDKQVRKNSTNQSATAISFEVRQSASDDSDFAGLLKFTGLQKPGKKIASATLTLVGERKKAGNRPIDVYLFDDNDWSEESTQYADVETAIAETRQKTVLASFVPAGVNNKALFDAGGLDVGLSAWINHIELTGLQGSTTDTLSFLLSADAELYNSTAQTCFYTKDATEEALKADAYQATVLEYLNNNGYQAEDLHPRLSIVYEDIDSGIAAYSATEDKQLRKNNTSQSGTNKTIEIKKVIADDSDFAGLFKFSGLQKAGKQIASATLKLVGERKKDSDGRIDIHLFSSNEWSEDTTQYADVSSELEAVRATAPLATFEPSGVAGKAMYDSGGLDVGLEGWTNEITLTGLQGSTADTISLLLSADEEYEVTDQICFYTKDVSEETVHSAVLEYLQDKSYTVDDLKPELTVVYEDTTEIQTGSDGIIKIAGLDWTESYYLKEIASPTGYVLDCSTIPVNIRLNTDSNLVEVEEIEAVNHQMLYDFNICKISSSVNKDLEGQQLAPTKLAGAAFTLYSDETCANVIARYITDSEGLAAFTDLTAGTYYLRETEAPAGYAVNSTLYRIEIQYENSTPVVSIIQLTDKNGKALDDPIPLSDGGLVSIDDYTTDQMYINPAPTQVSEKYSITFKVADDCAYELPQAGGMGTYLFTICGVAILVMVLLLSLEDRKRRKGVR